jgi:hypothetical protein
MYQTIPTTCKTSLLKNTGVLSTFHIEKPTELLSFFNVNEQKKNNDDDDDVDVDDNNNNNNNAKTIKRKTLWPPKSLTDKVLGKKHTSQK